MRIIPVLGENRQKQELPSPEQSQSTLMLEGQEPSSSPRPKAQTFVFAEVSPCREGLRIHIHLCPEQPT